MAINIQTPSASISASTSSSATAFPNKNGTNGVRILNTGTVPVFVVTGASTVTATTANQFVGAGATVEFLRSPEHTHLAAITASSTATVYFTACGV